MSLRRSMQSRQRALTLQVEAHSHTLCCKNAPAKHQNHHGARQNSAASQEDVPRFSSDRPRVKLPESKKGSGSILPSPRSWRYRMVILVSLIMCSAAVVVAIGSRDGLVSVAVARWFFLGCLAFGVGFADLFRFAPKSVSCLVSRFPMSQAEQYRHNSQDERTDHAGFGTHHSSRQPPWPIQSHIEEVVQRGKPAVGHTIKECLAPVIAEVKADRAP